MEEIEQMVSALLPLVMSSDVKGMLDNALNRARGNDLISAYWIVHSFQLGWMSHSTSDQRLFDGIGSIDQMIYRAIQQKIRQG